MSLAGIVRNDKKCKLLLLHRLSIFQKALGRGKEKNGYFQRARGMAAQLGDGDVQNRDIVISAMSEGSFDTGLDDLSGRTAADDFADFFWFHGFSPLL